MSFSAVIILTEEIIELTGISIHAALCHHRVRRQCIPSWTVCRRDSFLRRRPPLPPSLRLHIRAPVWPPALFPNAIWQQLPSRINKIKKQWKDGKTPAGIPRTLSYLPSWVMAAAFHFLHLMSGLVNSDIREEASSTSTCEAGKNGPNPRTQKRLFCSPFAERSRRCLIWWPPSGAFLSWHIDSLLKMCF